MFSILGINENETLPNSTHYFAKVRSKFCRTLNKPSKNCQIFFKMMPKWRNFAKYFLKWCQSGEISPNLVTLVPVCLTWRLSRSFHWRTKLMTGLWRMSAITWEPPFVENSFSRAETRNYFKIIRQLSRLISYNGTVGRNGSMFASWSKNYKIIVQQLRRKLDQKPEAPPVAGSTNHEAFLEETFLNSKIVLAKMFFINSWQTLEILLPMCRPDVCSQDKYMLGAL